MPPLTDTRTPALRTPTGIRQIAARDGTAGNAAAVFATGLEDTFQPVREYADANAGAVERQLLAYGVGVHNLVAFAGDGAGEVTGVGWETNVIDERQRARPAGAAMPARVPAHGDDPVSGFSIVTPAAVSCATRSSVTADIRMYT